MARLRHTVPAAAKGERLDRFLASTQGELSRARLQGLIVSGHVRVDGAAAKASYKLRGGETVEVVVPEPEPSELRAQDIPLKVLYQDPDLLVLDKAAGIVVHPGAGVRDGTLVNALLFHVRDLAGIGGELRPGIVHRLDRDTSGCLVVAKHEKALAALQRSFARRSVEKVYRAIVHGLPERDSLLIDTAYGRHPTERTRFTSRKPAGPPRRAVSHVSVLERFAGAALVEVRLETGRTHQIRVHLAESGHPVLADAVYGGTKREGRLRPDDPVRLAAEAIGRQALHAARLSFPHPGTGETLTCEAPLPDDFEAALRILRKRVPSAISRSTARPRGGS